MWCDRSRDHGEFGNAELVLFFASHSTALKISTISVRVLQGPHHDVLREVGRHMVGNAYSMVMRFSLAR